MHSIRPPFGFALVFLSLLSVVEIYAAPLENIDKRHPQPLQRTLTAQAVGRLPAEWNVTPDPISQSPRIVTSRSGFLDEAPITAQPNSAAAPFDPVRRFMRSHSNLFGHGPEILDQLSVTRDYTTEHNQLRTVRWQQTFQAIPVFEGVLSAQLAASNRLVSLSSRLVRDLPAAVAHGDAQWASRLRNAPVSAEEAIRIAAGNLGATSPPKELFRMGGKATPLDKQSFRAPGLKGETRARMVWFSIDRDTVRLAWQIDIKVNEHAETYRVMIDVTSGAVLVRRCMTYYLTDATYQVFQQDSPTPGRALSTPGKGQPLFLPRVETVISALSTNGSPSGWIDDGMNETLGNNVDAHTDWDDDDEPDLPRPHGLPRRIFKFGMDLAQSPRSYSNASVVQLFYWNNWMHDKLYDLGFNEAAGNFQTLNFGRGGEENDAVQADTQDGGGFDNSNFTVLEDGVPGRMQMYIFDGPKPNRDAALDADIVLHEYTHGLTGRMVGGGNALDSLQSGGMGEGWSDFYAITLLSAPGDDPSLGFAAGAYSSYKLEGEDANYYFGIRRYPYSTDLHRNPLTLKDIDPTQASLHAGIPMNPIFAGSVQADEVHSQGEVWCTTLWEARALFIQKYGFSEGTHQILQTVTHALRLSPPEPTFLDARDAIIQADLVNNNGGNAELLWRAFAKRGMGFGAEVPSSDTTVGVSESYDVPDDLLVTPIKGFANSGALGGPFTPSKGYFDIKNVSTNTVSWTAVSSAVWLALDSTGGELAPRGDDQEVGVELTPTAFNLPSGTYSEAIVFSNSVSGRTQTRSVKLRVGQPDYFTATFSDYESAAAFQNSSVTFAPDPGGSGYQACYEAAQTYPVDPGAAKALSFGDDTFVQVDLSEGRTFTFFGQVYTNVFIGGNGYLTFGKGTVDFAATLDTHFSLPRISAYSTDLDPTVGGQISTLQLPDRLVITFDQVPDFLDGGQNSFQTELFFDSRIRITWLQNSAFYGIVGLSAGGGIPTGFAETSFPDIGNCLPYLAISAPMGIQETAQTLNGSVSILTALATNLTVHLESENAKVTLSANVVIKAGETNAAFAGAIQVSNALEGTRLVRLIASADGYRGGSATVSVYDAEAASISVELPAFAREADAGRVLNGTVRLDETVPAPVILSLSSSDTARLSVPAYCVVPANSAEASFPITILNDDRVTGSTPITISAAVENWFNGSATIAWEDDESKVLSVTAPRNIAENSAPIAQAASVATSGKLIEPLTLKLRSDHPELIALPAEITIPAGASNILFDITPGHDAVSAGPIIVRIIAEASGFASGSATITFNDQDSPAQPFAPQPANGSTNNPPQVILAWAPAHGQILVNGDFERGELAPWVSESTAGGRFTIDDGTVDPNGPADPIQPASGSFCVVSEQDSPGRTTLSQRVSIPHGVLSAKLRWRDRIFNYGGVFDERLQDFRVEAQTPGGDTIGVLFQTHPDDPNSTDNWTQREVDLSDYLGTDMRIAFVQDATFGYLNVHLDDIVLELTSAAIKDYAIYFGSGSAPGSQDLIGRTTEEHFPAPALQLDHTYYWHIVAEGNVTKTPGPIWSFTVPPAGSVDHFVWGSIPQTWFADSGVPVRVTARDSYDNIATNFDGRVHLRGRANLPTNTIGIGSDPFESPLGGFFPSSRLQSIYLKSELGGPRVITGLALNVKDPPGELTRWTLRIKPTSLSNYNATNAVLERIGWTTVLQRDLTISSPGWALIPFSTPYTYDGTNNLLFDFSFKNAEFGASGLVLAYKTDTDRSLVAELYGGGDPLTISGDYAAPIDLVPQLQVFSEQPVDLHPSLSGDFTNGVWVGTASVSSVGDGLQLLCEDVQGHTGASSTFSSNFTNTLRLALLSGPDALFEKDNASYIFQIINPGPAAATGVTLSNLISGAATFQSATVSQGTLIGSSRLVIAQIGNLPPGTNATLTLNLVVGSTAPGMITNELAILTGQLAASATNSSLQVVSSVSAQPVISITDAEAVEASGNLSFALELSKASTHPITVDYVTIPDTASTNDFVPANGTITFPPASRTATIEIVVIDDNIDESDETMVLHLTNPVNATLQTTSATGTIIDDEGPDITVADASGPEGTGPIHTHLDFIVKLSTNTIDTVQVVWETLPLTADATDFEVKTGLVVFPPGTIEQKITINITADSRVEPDERFVFILDSATGGKIARARAFGTIINDDGLPGALDHFQFEPITSPQYVDEEFIINITALDRFGNAADEFDSLASLSALTDAQPIEIGDHSDTSIAPLDTTESGQRVQVIYLAREIGIARELTGLGLYVTETPTSKLKRFTIRLRQTPLSSYPDTPLWESTGWNTVYQNDISVTTTGLVTFAFSQSFSFDGRRNLMVDLSFLNDSADIFPGAILASDVGNPRIITSPYYGSFDNDPLSWTGEEPFTFGDTVLPDIQLLSAERLPLSIAQTGLFTNGVWSGRISLASPVPLTTLLVRDNEQHLGVSSNFSVALRNDLSITVSPSIEPVTVNDVVTYTVTIFNTGPTVSSNLIVTNDIPSGAILLTNVSSMGAFSNDLAHVYWTIPRLSGGSNVQATITLKTPANSGFIAGVASVGRAEPELYLTNNFASWQSSVLNVPDVSVQNAEAYEDSPFMIVPVLLSNPSSKMVSVDYFCFDNTAGPNDYVSKSGRIEFPPGSTAQMIQIPLVDDTVDELDEIFSVFIVNQQNALISHNEAICTIKDNDGPELVVSTDPIVEGNTGVQSLHVTFSLSQASVQEISFDVDTDDGTATVIDSDFSSYHDTITFAPGETNKTVAIDVSGDLKIEPDEYFWVIVTNLVNASIQLPNTKAIILNDDGLSGDLNNFLFDPLPVMVVAGSNQFVSILARDGYHNRAFSFSGSASLSAKRAVDTAVGTGETSWEYPLNSFAASRLETIYLTNELGGAFNIESLALDITGVSSFYYDSIPIFSIRIKPTSKGTFALNSSWDTDGWTTVYSGKNIPVNADGWLVFTLNTPFWYSGTNNLIVDFGYQPDSFSYTTLQGVSTAVSTYRSIAAQDQNFVAASDPTTWTGRRPPATAFRQIPNVKFSGSLPVKIASSTNVQFAAGIWNGGVKFAEPSDNVALYISDPIGRNGRSDAFTISTNLDSDGDGIPDAWEIAFKLDPANPSDATVDSDGDGVSNLNEYRSGTRPDNPSDDLRFYSAEAHDGSVTLSVLTVPGGSYVIERSTTLTAADWVEFARISQATNDLYRINDSTTNRSNRAFYRVRLEP